MNQKKKDNRGGAGRNQGRKKGPETKPFSIRTREEWIPIVKQVAKKAAKEKEAELKEAELKEKESQK